MGWLGRQIGHVKKAVQADVAKKPGTKRPAAEQSPKPAAAKTPPRTAEQTTTTQEKIIYREDKIEEAPLPDRPGVILRRTIIDEVVVETETKEPK
jgi:hypothetical protein